MIKRFIRSQYPFVYNLIFNKRRLDGNKIIHWYLLIKLRNNNDKAIYLSSNSISIEYLIFNI